MDAETPHLVLVVDDDPDIRAVLAEVLADEGYAVVTAVDGHEARVVAERVALVDANVPCTEPLSRRASWNGDV